jgi:hypothetical protein
MGPGIHNLPFWIAQEAEGPKEAVDNLPWSAAGISIFRVLIMAAAFSRTIFLMAKRSSPSGKGKFGTYQQSPHSRKNPHLQIVGSML